MSSVSRNLTAGTNKLITITRILLNCQNVSCVGRNLTSGAKNNAMITITSASLCLLWCLFQYGPKNIGIQLNLLQVWPQKCTLCLVVTLTNNDWWRWSMVVTTSSRCLEDASEQHMLECGLPPPACPTTGTLLLRLSIQENFHWTGLWPGRPGVDCWAGQHRTSKLCTSRL